jgi:hypothetical protein
MKTVAALGGGLAGASILTLIHETTRRISPKAPRMDLLGMNALAKVLNHNKVKVPGNKSLFLWTLASDVLGNALYYSLTGAGKERGVWWRGSLLGFVAGLGAVLLPKPLGLNESYSNRTLATKLMTVGLYLAGGLVASAIGSLLEHKKKDKQEE